MSFWEKAANTATGGVFAPSASKAVSGDSNLMSFIPGIGDAMAAKNQNAANIAASKAQMAFQERMSNTAYQRATADMKKAGINPMLAFSQGGASTPSGALPTINSESKSKLGEFALNTALGAKHAGINQQQANTAQNSAEQGINLSKAQTAETVARTQSVQAETALKKRELGGKGAKEVINYQGGKLIKNIIDSISNSAKSSKSESKSRLIDHLPDAGKSLFNFFKNQPGRSYDDSLIKKR